MSSNESSHFLDSNFQTINNNTHYQCHLCQQHFLFQSEFKMHLKQHGQQVNFICPQCQLSGRYFKEYGVSGQWIKSITLKSLIIVQHILLIFWIFTYLHGHGFLQHFWFEVLKVLVIGSYYCVKIWRFLQHFWFEALKVFVI